WSPPFTVSLSSGTGRHRHDVGEMNETGRRARDEARLGLILDLGERAPEVARGDEQLVDLRELRLVPVALVRRVEREAECAEGVLLADEEHRHRHREGLVDACERERLFPPL